MVGAVIVDPPFYKRAACQGTDPRLFQSDDPADQAAAKAICAACPVRRTCERHARRLGPDLPGIWGGLTEAERREPVKPRPGPPRPADHLTLWE